MAVADETVDLFDEKTWNDIDYSPLVNQVLARIATHAVHQQRCENYVQLAALVASTNVAEDRRTDRANALSYIMRPFNKDAVREVNKRRSLDTEKELKPLTRVEGWDRVKMFADQCDTFNSNIKKELDVIGKEKHGEIVQYITRNTNKVSRADLDATKEKFAKGINKVRKLTKSETNTCGLHVPAEMDGGVKMKDLQKKYIP